MQSIKNKRLNVFGLFFLLAFLFLVITKLSRSYTGSIDFNINYINVPENRIITLKKIPKINVEITALGFNILPYYFYERSIDIDFSKDVYRHENTYYWVSEKRKQDIRSQLSALLEVNVIQPDTLRFPFETLAVKKVPVLLDSKISFASGYNSLNDLKLTPDSVKVIGSVQKISEINSIKTGLLKLTNVNVDINEKLGLKIPKASQNVKLLQTEIIVTATVEKFTEGKLEIPITILNLPLETSINYFPKKLVVSYYVSLNNYKSVKANDFKVVCDYLEVSQTNKTFFIPKLIKIPNQVKNAKLKQNKVEFILKQ